MKDKLLFVLLRRIEVRGEESASRFLEFARTLGASEAAARDAVREAIKVGRVKRRKDLLVAA